MTAIDAEARAVIGQFVTGRLNENAMINWFTAARWTDDSEETTNGVEAFTRIFFGESTPRRERERLSVDYFGPDAAIWHEGNDWDERGQR